MENAYLFCKKKLDKDTFAYLALFVKAALAEERDRKEEEFQYWYRTNRYYVTGILDKVFEIYETIEDNFKRNHDILAIVKEKQLEQFIYNGIGEPTRADLLNNGNDYEDEEYTEDVEYSEDEKYNEDEE